MREWFNETHDGLMAAASMPESEPPTGILRGSTRHLLFLTLTVSIDYQRDASQLWDAARQTIVDPATAWLFQPRTVGSKSLAEIQAAMRVHALSRKHEKDSVIWKTICTSLAELFDSDLAILFKKCDNDAMMLYCEMRNVYPSRNH